MLTVMDDARLLAGSEHAAWSERFREAPDGQVFFGADSYFLVRVSEPLIDPGGQEPLERSVITGHRWWTAGELRASSEVIIPPGLGRLVERLLSGMPAAAVRLPWRS